MFNAANSVFIWNGVQYIVKKQPARLWPCQNCDLCEQCTAENFGEKNFPTCRGKNREDHQDVVFFEYADSRSHRREV